MDVPARSWDLGWRLPALGANVHAMPVQLAGNFAPPSSYMLPFAGRRCHRSAFCAGTAGRAERR